MLVGEAKQAAERWVRREGIKVPGLVGAFLAGSVTRLPDEALLPASSDVDITVVVKEPPRTKLGKFRYQGVLLEVSFEDPERLSSVEAVLGDPHLAGGVSMMEIIVDSTGTLRRFRNEVFSGYTCDRWVRRRCQASLKIAEERLQPLGRGTAFHDRVTAWLFGTSMTAFILLTAGVEPPTVRRRYVEVRKMLADLGRLGFHEALLGLLGCSDWSRDTVEKHMDAVATAFDCAKTMPKGDFAFGADISDAGRPVAIDGSRALIGQGSHREAVFWMVATYSRCKWIFDFNRRTDCEAPMVKGYFAMLNDLGIGSISDLETRRRQSLAFLPRVMEVAEAVRAASPELA